MDEKKSYVSIASLAFYFICDYFFSDTGLYLVAAPIALISEALQIDLNFQNFFVFGYLTLVSLTILIFIVQKKVLKLLILLPIPLFLYMFDYVLLEFISYDPNEKATIIIDTNYKRIGLLAIRIIMKASLLSFIISKGFRLGTK